MRSSKEIKGLKIISLAEGRQVSSVKDLILDPEGGRIAFFVIDQPSDYFGARLITFRDIIGLGDYALIISDTCMIQDVAHNQQAIELLQKDCQVLGSEILSEKGCLIGRVEEVFFDEETGRIVAFEIINPEGIKRQIKCHNIIAYGKEIIIMSEQPDNERPADFNRVRPANAVRLDGKFPVEQLNIDSDISVNEKEILKKKIEEFSKNGEVFANQGDKERIIYPEDFNVFEQRQLQFLEGKKLEKDVVLDNGQILEAGRQITAEVLSAVKTRSTLMQMTAHVVKSIEVN